MRFTLKKRLIIFRAPPYKRRLILSFIMLGFLLLAMVSSFWVMDRLIGPGLNELAGVRAKQIVIERIHRIIQTKIAPKLDYDQLIELQLTGDGKVAYLESKIGMINRISATATLAAQQYLKKLPPMTVRIPLGQILGFKTLASYGPLLPIKVISTGVVESSIKDRFDSVGINQVRHKVFIRIKTSIKMVAPLVKKEMLITTDVPLTEAIIMGEVPNLYFGPGRMFSDKQ